MTRFENSPQGGRHPVQVFLKIIKMVSEGRLRLKPTSTISELFQDPAGFGPLEYELCLYSLAATLQHEIDNSLYEEDLGTTIADLIARNLHFEMSDDPLFVARQFKKFAKSAGWEGDEKTEPGKTESFPRTGRS